MNRPKLDQLYKILDDLRLKDRRSWILMVPNSIGEVALVCGFAKSFVEKHGFGVTLVIREEHNSIAAMYPKRFNAVKNLTLHQMRDFSSYGVIPPNHFDIDFPFNTWPMQYGDGELFKIRMLMERGGGRGGITHSDLYRYMLRLDWDSPLETACVSSESWKLANEIVEINNIERGNSVILFPGNNTSIPAPYDFWIEIANAYKAKGKHVFTNVSGASYLPGKLPIPGTKALELGIDSALAVSELAGHMIIGSNGLLILSLLAGINCRIDGILTDRECIDGSVGFVNANWMRQSCQLAVPELAIRNSKYSEWVISAYEKVINVQKLALDIVENRQSEMRVTPDKICEFLSYNSSEWAKSLVI
jgi:hypothetical protein